MSETFAARRPYRSDLSDERWALIEPMLVAWRATRAGLGIGGPRHDLREIVNAILYVNRTGIAWAYLPHDFPPYQTVYDYSARWAVDGTTEAIHDAVRGRVRTPARAGRAAVRGGRGCAVREDLGQRGRVLAGHRRGIDAGKRSKAAHGIAVEVVRRAPGRRGFAPLPMRWAAERTFGWLMLHRRLVRGYETPPERSRTMIFWSMLDNMIRRDRRTPKPGDPIQPWPSYHPWSGIRCPLSAWPE